ncbi:hypothetical protein MRX96_001485 [Rhipicephalus microplus]
MWPQFRSQCQHYHPVLKRSPPQGNHYNRGSIDDQDNERANHYDQSNNDDQNNDKANHYDQGNNDDQNNDKANHDNQGNYYCQYNNDHLDEHYHYSCYD